MDEILIYLQSMLSVLITTFGFKTVQIATDEQLYEGLKLDQLPGLFISAIGEDFFSTVQGITDMGDEKILRYTIKLRYFWGSVVKQAPLIKAKMNIYQLTQNIRNILCQDKTLNGLVLDGLDFNMRAVDLPTIGQFKGDYLGRDMYLYYYDPVRWDGNINKQISMSPNSGLGN